MWTMWHWEEKWSLVWSMPEKKRVEESHSTSQFHSLLFCLCPVSPILAQMKIICIMKGYEIYYIWGEGIRILFSWRMESEQRWEQETIKHNYVAQTNLLDSCTVKWQNSRFTLFHLEQSQSLIQGSDRLYCMAIVLITIVEKPQNTMLIYSPYPQAPSTDFLEVITNCIFYYHVNMWSQPRITSNYSVICYISVQGQNGDRINLTEKEMCFESLACVLKGTNEDQLSQFQVSVKKKKRNTNGVLYIYCTCIKCLQ